MLSCSLNLTWPDPEWKTAPAEIPDANAILGDLNEVVGALSVQSRASDSHTSVEDGKFSGWVSYPNVECAAAAATLLRDLLHSRGLLVKQRARDLIIPRA